jgi:hypothetical protein
MARMSQDAAAGAAPVRRRVGELTASVWLDLWERGQASTSAQRALAWLQAARLVPEDDPAAWSITERDAQILLLRETAFGTQMQGSADCPACNQRLELRFTTRELLPRLASPSGAVAIDSSGYLAQFRLPAAGDVARLSTTGASSARDQLLAACFLSGQCDGDAVDFAELPEPARRAAESAMARRDPYANIELSLNCPACQRAWAQPFDPTAFLWIEVDSWARRTLNEVHTLASAYGWTESEILRLSPTRRYFYLSLIGT